MSVVRFGVLGTGWPALQHARALRHVAGAELVSACDAEAERRARYAAEFCPCRVVAAVEDVLADPLVDAVIVCLPNHLHFSACAAALNAGKHVLCEKPPTLTLNEMETLRDEAQRRRLTYAFSRQFRFSAPMLAARRLVESGELGRVYLGKAQWVRLRGAPGGVGGWFVDKARAGGGAVVDLGIHSLDAVWHLAGCPRVVSVSAHTGTYFPGAGDVEDTGFAFLRFEGELIVSLEVAWSMNIAGADATPSEWWGLEAIQTALHGTLAALQIAPPEMVRSVVTGGIERRPLPLRADDEFDTLPEQLPAFARQLKDFVRAVASGAEPVNNADQAVELMKMLAAIYKSSATGREVCFS